MSISRERETIVAMGTNLGNRGNNILEAARLLDQHVSMREFSPVFETRPLGAASRHPFYNCICRFFWRSGPYDLLRVLQKIETQMGRRRLIKWGNRVIDLDIVSMEGVRMNDSALSIPHPGNTHRSFVLLPLQALFNRGTVPGIEGDLRPHLQKLESSGWRRVCNPPTRRRGIWNMNHPGIS